MDTQSVTKREQGYLSLSFFIAFMLSALATTTADRLSGKFFPPDSPFLANLYPNDFLPWGLLLFLVLGWITVNFICRRFNNDPRLVIISCLITIIVVMFLAINVRSRLDNLWLQSNEQAAWAHYLAILVWPWSYAWVMGGSAAFSTNIILPTK